ncbi:uncharacterized protein [Halyomorpha halys]|nr:uncharacterized protein LOC106683807 isoform X2 [Halyomorpha halys]XP_014280993.1 uncharacterized protein LOC106683807 isoform X2 [Halyomorpha halys]XP_024217416.1 uncharacterized protein LOC106683807 isoform X2 [Halyomorpha halys]
MDYYDNTKVDMSNKSECSQDQRYCNQDLLMPQLRTRATQGPQLLQNKNVGNKSFNSDSESISSMSSNCSIENPQIGIKRDSQKKNEPPKYEPPTTSYGKFIHDKKVQPVTQTYNMKHGQNSLLKLDEETDRELEWCNLNINRNAKKRPDQKMKLLKDKRYGIPCVENTNLNLQLLHYGSNQEGGDGKGDLSGFLAEPVNWNEIKVPKKRELHRVIHHRLCNYINPDIMLVIDEHEFFCHRIVLQSYSKYFDEIDNLDQSTIIDLKEKNVTKEAFIAIYAWMLSLNDGGLKFLTRDNIIEVLMASQSLQIRDLEEQCFALIDSKELFSEGHAYQLFKKASHLKQNGIKELMVPRVQHFFLPLVSSQDFVNLSLDDLCTFLTSNYIVVHSEMEVFMSAAKWLLENWDERKKHLPRVMTCVRFGLMHPPELIDIRKNPESPEFLRLTEDIRIQKFIEDGMAYSIESTLKGATEDHKYRCQLLGLEIPQPRNWAESPKYYKSYEEFLGYLQLLRGNPMMMFATEKEKLIPEPIKMNKPMHNYSVAVDPSNCCSEFFRVPYQYSCDDGIPSMSVLLAAGMKNRKRRENQKAASRNHSKDKHSLETAKLEKKAIINKEKELKNENLYINPEKRERKKRNVSTRRDTTLKNKAATIIQTAFRGYRVRKMVKLKKRESNSAALSYASSHRNVKFESHHVHSDGDHLKNKQIQNCSSDSDLDLTNRYAGNGRSSLYFPHSQTILVIGGLDPLQNLSQNNDGSSIFRYSVEMNSWEKVATMPKGRYYHSATLLKGKIYVLGGVDPRKEESGVPAICSDMWSFNPATCDWIKEPSLRTARKTFGLVAFHGYLYIIGGQDNHQRILSSVEKFDPVKGTWEEVSALPEPRLCPAVCRYGGMIWVAGGMGNSTKNDMSSQIFCFDPQQNMWVRKPTLRFGRGFSALINHEDNLLLVGGAVKEGEISVSNDIIDILDSKHNKWKLHSHMSIPRHSHTVSCIGSKMFIIGGSTTKYRKTLNNVEMCCLKTGIWNKQAADLPVPLTGHASVTLPLGSPIVR